LDGKVFDIVELFNSVNSSTCIHILERDLKITTEVYLISAESVPVRKSIQRSGLKTAWEFALLKHLVLLNTSTKISVTDSNLINAMQGVVGTLQLVTPENKNMFLSSDLIKPDDRKKHSPKQRL
jgi:hypothetical protein